MTARAVSFSAFLILLPIPCLAIDAPALPASAKKQTGAEIMALYDGQTYAFNNFTEKEPLTGQTTYDLEKKITSGKWVMGKSGGDFKAKARVNGDQFCYTIKGQKEKCT